VFVSGPLDDFVPCAAGAHESVRELTTANDAAEE
jgi:hypothetical protein